MRLIRELPVAAPLLLVGLSLFFGGGPADGSIFWLGAGVLVAMFLLLGTVGIPGGFGAAAPLVLLAAWCAASIAWSGLPDRSWDYANRALLYALFATLGLWAAGRTRTLANGLAAVLGAVIVWSLLGKVFPSFYDYGGPDVTRLRGPIGLWNQLALATVYALALALAVRGRLGALLAYAGLVALVLTYSRGGLLTAFVVCVAWFVLSDEQVESAVTLVAAALPAAIVGGIGFALPGITSDYQSSHVRWRDGLVFGALLLAGGGATLVLARLRSPWDARRVRRAASGVGVAGALGAILFIAVHGVGSGTVGNGSNRFSSTSSNFRFTWWHQAWHGFVSHPLGGIGAGAFNLLNLRYRTSYLDFTTEPHDLPVQFLAELGLVGLALLVAGVVLLVGRPRRRPGHELALWLLLPAFLLHSLFDVDWDFVAVTVPAFAAAGALAGRPAAERRVGGLVLLPAVGVAIVAFGSLGSPWLARRWTTEAYAAGPARTVTLANRAHAFDPLLVDPYWLKGDAFEAQGRERAGFDQFVSAVHRQPKNPQTWLFAGEYAKRAGCPFLAWQYLERYTELDPKSNGPGGDEYRAMLALVNKHAYRC